MTVTNRSIQSFLKKTKRNRGINYHLDNFNQALAVFNNPHLQLKNIIHIAGTNGKGSTLTFLATALRAFGFTVGTYTSPHITSYQERICFDTQVIPAAYLLKLLRLIKARLKKHMLKLTEFEMLTLVSFLYFLELKPDFLIYEVGLGGRLDATNVVPSILTIITKISVDHQDILGQSIAEITTEKAGIIKDNTPIVSLKHSQESCLIIKEMAHNKKAPLFMTTPQKLKLKSFKLAANYQNQNLALAKTAVDVLKRYAYIPKALINKSSIYKNADLWGRYATYQKDKQFVIVDAAHNEDGIRALKEALQVQFPNTKPTFLISLNKTKDHHKMLSLINGYAEHIYYCEFDKTLCLTRKEVLAQNNTIKLKPYQKTSALSLIKTTPLVITGSIYFIANFFWLNKSNSGYEKVHLRN
jgi:dihydrofolate synthase/folylpolyglutamate synthase